jgi:hypothetical protein
MNGVRLRTSSTSDLQKGYGMKNAQDVFRRLSTSMIVIAAKSMEPWQALAAPMAAHLPAGKLCCPID